MAEGYEHKPFQMYSGMFAYDATAGGFPLGDAPEPLLAGQLTLLGRNVNNGAIYAVWYRANNKCFYIGQTIKTPSPDNGDEIFLSYTY